MQAGSGLAVFGEHETRILSQPSPLVASPFGTSPFPRFSLNRPLAEFKILPLILFSYSLLIRDSHHDTRRDSSSGDYARASAC